MTNRRRVRLVTAAALLLLCTRAMATQWLFDPNQRLVAGPTVRDGTTISQAASSFYLNTDVYADTFSVAAMKLFGPAGSGFTCSLTETDYGVPDLSRTLASWTIQPLNATPQYYDATVPEVFLRAWTVYSIVVQPGSGDFAGGLSWMQYAGHSGWGSAGQGQTWVGLIYPMCIRVGGRVVPEPTSLAVLFTGLACLGGARRRRT